MRPEPARIFTPDGRYPLEHVTRTGIFAPVGLVAIPVPPGHPRNATPLTTYGVSTGFLVSPCHVQMTAHALTQVADANGAIPGRVQFLAGYSAWRGFAHRDVEGEVVRRGDFPARGRGHDWAIIRLKRCVGEDPEIGWMVPGTPSAERQPASVVGMFSDQATDAVRHIFFQERCELRQRRGEVWLNSCAGRPGASGSPIFRISPDGVPVVLAMQVAIQGRTAGPAAVLTPEGDWTPANGNLAVDERTVLADPWVAETLAADVARFGRPNPQLLMARERQGGGRV